MQSTSCGSGPRGGGISATNMIAKNIAVIGNGTTYCAPSDGTAIWLSPNGSSVIESSIIFGNWGYEYNGVGGPDPPGSAIFGSFISTSNLFYNNPADSLFAGGTVDSSGHVHAPPLLSPDGHLLVSSPAIDHGKMSTFDPDGSRADMGAFGGPGAIMSQPTRVAAAQGTATEFGISLNWAQVAAPDLQGYAIYRSETPGIHPTVETLIELTQGISTSFLDRFAFPGTTYFYRVDAYDSSGLGGGYSDEVEANAIPWFGEGGSGANLIIPGNAAGFLFGTSVLAADLNHDAFDDLVVGDGAGRVRIFWGKSSFSPASESDVDVVILAPRPEGFGRTLASGDVSGDGIEDLLIGASEADPMGRSEAGAVYVIEGKSTWPPSPVTIDLAIQPADKTILGAAGEDHAGASIAVGDLNSDQSNDLIIGSPGHLIPSGKSDGEVRVLYSIASLPDSIDLTAGPIQFTMIHSDSGGQSGGDRFGSSLACGDVNQDDIADLVIGSPEEDFKGGNGAGAVHVIAGSIAIIHTNAINLRDSPGLLRIDGATADDQLGSSVALVDLDGDGGLEILAGAPNANRPIDDVPVGAAYVVRFAVLDDEVLTLATEDAWLALYGRTSGDRFGSAVAIGRAAATPFSHLLVGAPSALSDCGQADAIWGGRSLYPGIILLSQSNADWRLDGPANDGNSFYAPRLGGSVALGDFDGNGVLDCATGAPGADIGGLVDAGSVHLVMNEDAAAIVAAPSMAGTDRFSLRMSGANPCRGRAELVLALPQAAHVELSVFDISGRRLWHEARPLPAGHNQILWNGIREDGSRVASGVYLVKAEASGERVTQRIVLLR